MSLCHKCGKETGGAKFCPHAACGELQQNIQIERKQAAPSFNKEKQNSKKELFEQKIKEAAPKEVFSLFSFRFSLFCLKCFYLQKVKKKKTWAQTNTGGDMYGQGKVLFTRKEFVFRLLNFKKRKV